VAATAFHHVGVTLWRSEAGYELFLPRGFALSLWELLYESAQQFGVEVV
jgi:sarcosine oxidase gamma subunit